MIPAQYHVRGIVIKRRNVGEADRIITILTREKGKIRTLAKGVRRIASRRAPYLEVFSHTVFSIRKGKTLDSISEAASAGEHLDASASVETMGVGYYLCEVVDGLIPEHERNPDAYELLHTTLLRLRNDTVKGGNHRGLAHQFLVRLLRMLGYIADRKEPSFAEAHRMVEQLIERRLHSVRLLTALKKTV